MCKIAQFKETTKYIDNQLLTRLHSDVRTKLDTLGFRDPAKRHRKVEYSATQKLSFKKAKSQRLAEGLRLLNSPLKKQYERTLTCLTYIKQEGYNISASCCRCRWCFVCNGKRTRKMIDQYLPILKKSNNYYFVTLTRRTITGDKLRGAIKTNNKIISDIAKRSRRKGNKIDFIRSLETTHNKIENKYHPHYHLLVKGKENAEFILQEWINTSKGDIGEGGQDIRKFGEDKSKSLEEHLTEFFKYTTKLDEEINDDTLEVLDTIFVATSGIQLVQTYGDIKATKEISKEMKINENFPFSEFALWRYNIHCKDWIRMSDGYLLGKQKFINDLNFIPPPN